MAEQTIVCTEACTVTVQLEITNPLLNLDNAAGIAIAGAVLAVWAVGFGIRALIQTLKNSDGNSTDEGN